MECIKIVIREKCLLLVIYIRKEIKMIFSEVSMELS